MPGCSGTLKHISLMGRVKGGCKWSFGEFNIVDIFKHEKFSIVDLLICLLITILIFFLLLFSKQKHNKNVNQL